MLTSAEFGRYAMAVSLYATSEGVLLTRRRFVSACAAGAVAVVPAPRRLPLLVPGLAAQAVALKDLVPRGWTIGAALNQNQSDGRRRSRHATVQHHHRFTFEAADRY